MRGNYYWLAIIMNTLGVQHQSHQASRKHHHVISLIEVRKIADRVLSDRWNCSYWFNSELCCQLKVDLCVFYI